MKQLCQNFILALKRNIDMYFFCVQKITRIYREGDKNIQLEILWKKIQQKIITYRKNKNKTKQNRTQIINGWQKDIFISWYCKRLIWKYWKLSRFSLFYQNFSYSYTVVIRRKCGWYGWYYTMENITIIALFITRKNLHNWIWCHFKIDLSIHWNQREVTKWRLACVYIREDENNQVLIHKHGDTHCQLESESVKFLADKTETGLEYFFFFVLTVYAQFSIA